MSNQFTPEQYRIAKQLVRQLRQMTTIARENNLTLSTEHQYVQVADALDEVANSIVNDIICAGGQHHDVA